MIVDGSAQQMGGILPDFVEDAWDWTKGAVADAVVLPYDLLVVKPAELAFSIGSEAVGTAIPAGQSILSSTKDAFQSVRSGLTGSGGDDAALAAAAAAGAGADEPPWGLIIGGVAVAGLLGFALFGKKKKGKR